MKRWSDFFDYVLPELPACPQDLATVHIRNACIDFMDDAGVMVLDHDPITVVAGTHTYDFMPQAGWDIARTHSAWFDNVELLPKGEDYLRQAFPRWTTEVGTPRFLTSENQTSLRVVPSPDANSAGVGRLTLRVVVRPTRTAVGVDDWVHSKWVDVIASKAKADLMAIPAKPWTNPAMSVYYAGVYRRGLGDAVRDVNRGLSRAQVSVHMRPAA